MNALGCAVLLSICRAGRLKTGRIFVPLPSGAANSPDRLSVFNTTEIWVTQPLDHFAAVATEDAGPGQGQGQGQGEGEGDIQGEGQGQQDGSPNSWKQRVFVYDGFVNASSDSSGGEGGKEIQAVFFYVGNEADVTLYVNATGLMWEHGSDFKALLVPPHMSGHAIDQ